MIYATYQDLAASKAVVPCLAITVHRSFTVNLDVLTTPYHEGDTLLEGIVEVVVLPIFNVVGKLHHPCQTNDL
jgi:hypothetical protein